MGGFFLVCRNSPQNIEDEFQNLKACFAGAGFGAPEIIVTEHYLFAAYPKFQDNKPELLRYRNGDFVFVCGTCISDEGLRLGPARRMYEAVDKEAAVNQFFGHYAIVLCQNGRTEIILDRFGGYHLYYNQEKGVISTSLYAIASVLPQLTVTRQSAFEYVFNGVISGDETLFKEVCLAPIQGRIVISSGTLEVSRPPQRVSVSTTGEPPDVVTKKTIALLDQYFAEAIRIFGDNVGTALSGGYDSRLVLAFLRRHGARRPRLYVYGRQSDSDVHVASQIASGEGLPITIIDKEADEPVRPYLFADTAHRNFIALDGYGYGGIFNSGAELGESARRVAGNTIAFNGGGGEIFRNFFYLSDRRHSIRELLWAFYSQFDPAATTRLFDSETYYLNLEEKIKALVDCDELLLPRPTVERLYHTFRCRAWDGKVDSLANRFGHTAMPFLERQITEHASMLPLSWKTHGAYEAQLITAVDARLAGYPSVYGHPFDRAPPPSRRLRDYASQIRPPWLRRYTHRIKHRWIRSSREWQGYLAPEYVRAALPGGPDVVQRLFRLNFARDPHQYERILSLEYALRQFGSRVKVDF
jgi:asparagine synthase (glutamine-hydrolysing)